MIHDFLARWATIEPERTAIQDVASGRAVPYGVLCNRASRLSLALTFGLGLSAGARIVMLTGARVEVFEALFAAARAKVTLIPLNSRLTVPELIAVISDAEPSAVLYDDQFAPAVEEIRRAVPLARGIALGTQKTASHDDRYEELLERAHPATSPGIEMESVPLVLYTSGTTGTPKGVMIPWRQILFNAVNTQLACGLGPDDACLACLPLFHTGGLNCLATPILHCGGRVVLTPHFDAEEVVALLSNGRASSTIAVPVMVQAMMAAGLRKDSQGNLRSLLVGGAPCPLPLIEQCHDSGVPLRQGYGLTEVGPNCFTLAPLKGPHRLGSVGWPAFHGEARLVDDSGMEVKPGDLGELLLRGPHVTAGYLGQPSACDAAGWFRTGDIFRATEDGAYYPVGRSKDMFISGGENVYPGEIERALDSHPAVKDVAVIGVPDDRWGEAGFAAVVLDPGFEIELLNPWLRERLAGYKMPRHWRVVSELPRTITGKVDRTALRRLLSLDRGVDA